MLSPHPQSNDATTAESRILVTRKRPPKRTRPGGDNNNKEGNGAYWVLGWVTSSSVSVKIHGTDTARKRETVVVAGFLPVDRPLTHYQETVEKLKATAARAVGPENDTGCACLVDSLQILAFWDPSQSKGTVGVDETTTPPRENASSLRVLNNQRGYPWWSENGESRLGRSASPRASQLGYDQVLLYELNDDERDERLSLDHFASGFGGNGTDWSVLIHRINHSNEILHIVQTGKVPPEIWMGQPNNTSKKDFHDESINWSVKPSEMPHDDAPSESSTSLYHQVQQFVVNHSLIILHLLHLRSIPFTTTMATSFYPSSFLSFFSVYRSIQSLLHLSTYATNSQSHIGAKPYLIPSRSELAKQKIARWDAFFSATLDMFLGFFFCATVVILSQHASFVGTMILSSKIQTFEALKGQIGWLETFPAGFKLNVQLTHNMGQEIRNLLHHQERILLSTLWSPHFCRQYLIPFLAAIAAAGGWTAVLAVLVDLWRLENLHLIVLAASFRRLYQAELYLLSALFRLFRGKKRNPLRQRTDSMQYDAMQLLVGTVGFCICVFLWTTIMVYYTFFVFWNLAMHLTMVVLWTLYSLTLSVPLGSLLWRILRPGWFPKDLYIEFLGRDCSFASSSSSSNNRNNSSNVVQISHLVSIPVSPGHILARQTAVHVSSIYKWYLAAFLEVLIPRSSNSSPITLPVASLIENLIPLATSTTARVTNTNLGNGIGNNSQPNEPKSKKV